MINVAIVEDNQQEQKLLSDYICRYGKENGLIFHIQYFENGVTFVSGRPKTFDIIFMDIEMPHMNGMEAAEILRRFDTSSCLIFVTNMAQYAIKGYEVNAMDFIVKPVTYSGLSYRLARAVKRVGRERGNHIILKKKDGIYKINIPDICYVEVKKHQLLYHTINGTVEAWDTFKNCISTLEPNGFSCCNSCYLVNLNYVESIQDEEVIVGGERLKISRAKKKAFMESLLKFWGE